MRLLGGWKSRRVPPVLGARRDPAESGHGSAKESGARPIFAVNTEFGVPATSVTGMGVEQLMVLTDRCTLAGPPPRSA
jgi:hypothetical protein